MFLPKDCMLRLLNSCMNMKKTDICWKNLVT